MIADPVLTPADLVAQIQRAADDGDEIMEMAVAVGADAARTADQQRVVLGELARLLTVRYNEGTIEAFAKACGLQPVTVRTYRAVVRTLTFDTAYRFAVEEGVPWIVMRDAVRYYGSEPERAVAFIEDAADKRKTIDEAQRDLATASGKPPKPATLVPEVDAPVIAVDLRTGHVTLSLGDAANALSDRVGAAVAVRVTEAG